MKLSTNKLLLSCLVGTVITTASMGVTLEGIKVTTVGLGEEESIEDVHATVSVIDAKAIAKTSARSVQQVLNEVGGLYVKDGGSNSSVSIRGFDESQTLILVDGLRITGKYGSSDLSSISLDNVERIEVIKGPMSALYGADAVAGVINIITKKATRDYVKATVLGGIAQNGERGTGIVRVHSGTVSDTMTHNISFEAREKDEYRIEPTSVGTDLSNASQQFLSYGNTVELGQNDRVSTKLEFARQDDDGASADRLNNRLDTYEKENRYRAALQHKHAAQNYLIDTNLGYSYSDAQVDRGSGLETTDYKQLEINSYLRHFTTDSMTNIFGIGYRDEKIDVSIHTQEASRENYNLFFQNDYEIIDNLTSSVGVRYDHFSDFGDSLTPKASLMYKYSDFKTRVSYGEAFKAPNFVNMYGYFVRGGGTTVISGNENLEPEESKTFEYTIGYAKDALSFDITHHRTKLDNLIAYSVDRIDNIGGRLIRYGTQKNIAKSQINGTEVSLGYKFDYGVSANLAWEDLDTKDEATGDRLIGSADTTSKVNISYERDNMDMHLNVKQYNDYYDSNERRENVNSDYIVADVKMNYRFNDTIECFVGVDNLQNKIMPYNMRLFGSPNDPGERFYYAGLNLSL